MPAGLCAALLIVAIHLGSHGTAAAVRGAPVNAVSAPTRTSKTETVHQKPIKRFPKTDWGRDPFHCPSPKDTAPGKSGSSKGIRLVGVIGGQKGKMALLGHSIVQKGDTIGNERILDIDENGVTLTRDGSKRIIAMEETP